MINVIVSVQWTGVTDITYAISIGVGLECIGDVETVVIAVFSGAAGAGIISRRTAPVAIITYAISIGIIDPA